ncbi:MAG TPA: DEAD/DEAH box helicase [Sedimentisphaerales bacterium]|jgi:superfamily II DNA or RNA helicase|nr:DEAD/DEAH box helicase [Sedimentisphaerales bacterium]HNU29947.1 DEAD/DEAH box helicase [Sedimentisphaerales bacterium]
MDVTADRFRGGQHDSKPAEGKSQLLEVGSPSSIEEAALLMYALSFGPLSKNDLARALKQVGMTMRDGSGITIQKLGVCIQRLKERGQISSVGSEPACCPPDVRAAVIETARNKGWLRRFAVALQRAVPALVGLDSWDYRWGRRRFVSFHHACRDVFLALEDNDQDELKRLAGLCSQDDRITSLVNVLLVVCMDPFQPACIERLIPQYRDLVLSAGLHQRTIYLRLNHPVFAYARTWLAANRQCLDKSLLQRCVVHIAERDLLAGDFAAARAILETFADLDTWIVRGMLELLSGRIEEARRAYEQAQRQAGKSKTAQIDYLNSFPAFLHALLLVQSDRPEDHQQARTWLTWLDTGRGYGGYSQAYRLLATLLLWYEGHNTADDLQDGGMPLYRESTPLIWVCAHLMRLLGQLYRSQNKTVKSDKGKLVFDLENCLRECQENGALWPEMQIARLANKLGLDVLSRGAQVDAFFQETGAKDLSELWPIKEIWESRVAALEQFLRDAERVAHGPADSSRRLVWKLRQWGRDQIAVVPVEQKRTKTGAWTKGREIAVSRLIERNSRDFNFLTDQDKAVLGAIMVKHSYFDLMYHLDSGVALRALAGHPNVFWEDAPHLPVEIVSAQPEVHIVPKGDRLCICMDPYPDPRLHDEGAASLVVRESLTRVRVIVFEPVHRRMAQILGPEGVGIPKDRANEALARLQGLSRHVAIQSGVALAAGDAEAVEPDCRPRLRLQRLEQGLRAEMVVVPLGDQSPRAFPPGAGNSHLVEFTGGKTLQTRRRLAEETERASQAFEAVKVLDAEGCSSYVWTLEDPEEALELLENLQAVPPEVLTVEWPKGDPITVRSLSPQQFHLSIHSAQNWFEVKGEVQVDKDLMVQMRTLLDEIENADTRFIALGKDQYIALTRQLRKQLQWFSAGGQFIGKGNTLRVHPLAAIGLEQWKDEIGEFHADAEFDAHIERIRAVEKYQPAIPSTLQATLRPYQVDGFVWLARLAEWGVGACLADDMGLGKTIEALALILHRASQGPTLVAAPTSVCANWVSEAQRFAPTLRPVRFGIGDLGRREDVLKALGPFDLAICSYTLLQQEADAIKDVQFATIVLDEAQAIKNAATKRSSAAMNLTGGFRMICTGTPIENRLAELWNLFRFINPGLLGSEERFRERFVRPIEGGHDPHASHILKAIVQPFILRRTKSQVLEDLPPRTESMRLVELSPEERALHESLRQRALERLEGAKHMDKGQAHIQVLAELMKLRRCCCNPRLVMPNCGLTGSKLEAFAELVDELLENQHKALVFSQFVDHLTLLREHLDERKIRYQYLDGATPAKTRQKRIDAFQNGEGALFLISLKAGGLGLNLTAADYVIHMDPWWNPAVEDQASDRAHRIGQTRPVTVYRLVAADTIEEKIVQLHHAKRDLADSLLEGTDTAHTLTADELIDLLRNR